jgi:hypothetical protein
MDEARRAGAAVLPQLTDFQTKVTTSHWRTREGVRSRVHEHLAGAHNAQERAARVLELLCDAQSAQCGHLYLYQGGGIELVASRGGVAPSPQLCERVARFAEDQLCADERATVFETESGWSSDAATCWTDDDGAMHHFALMIVDRGTARLCAGVLVVQTLTRMAIGLGARQLLTEVADELFRLGDAKAIPAASR